MLDGAALAGKELMEELEQMRGVEGVDLVGGAGAIDRSGTLNHDDGNVRRALANGGDDCFAGDVVNHGVEDSTVDVREMLKGLDGFFAAVGGDDIEFCGLDDQLARGDGAGVFAVDDEKTGPNHGDILRGKMPVPSDDGAVIVSWNV